MKTAQPQNQGNEIVSDVVFPLDLVEKKHKRDLLPWHGLVESVAVVCDVALACTMALFAVLHRS